MASFFHAHQCLIVLPRVLVGELLMTPIFIGSLRVVDLSVSEAKTALSDFIRANIGGISKLSKRHAIINLPQGSNLLTNWNNPDAIITSKGDAQVTMTCSLDSGSYTHLTITSYMGNNPIYAKMQNYNIE